MHEQQLTNQMKQRATQILLECREKIINEWAERAINEVSRASSLDRRTLVNSLPSLIDCIARALAASSSTAVSEECEELAHHHGGERAKASDYNPDELVQEYCIFCDVIIETLGSEATLTANDFQLIYKVIGEALQNSMSAYSDIQTDFRERFIATLAHDLRNPLGVARTAAELITLECHDPEEVCFLASRLQSNLKRADDLMQSLLDVAYMHSGYELNYQMESCDLARIISETVQSMSLTHGHRFMVIGDEIVGYWNISALRRSLENLLSNAVKYGAHDKPVGVEFKLEKDRVKIKVHNEGRPIPQADQKKIFQPFQREKTVLSSKPGWGLGLCFVQTAAEAHGGKVYVDSDETGTDFTIELPVDARRNKRHFEHH